VADLRFGAAARVAAACAGLGAVLPAPLLACGYENPAAVATGALNLSFPDALHVGTAIWQAQGDGLLPRTDPATPAGSLMAQQATLWEVMRLLDRLRAQLEVADDPVARPALSLVFVSSVLWTRFASSGGRVATQMHASGPGETDVVIVTEPLVIRALVERRMDVKLAIERGLVRLYGDAAQITAALHWLQRMGTT
jgi:hypothetical protein